MMTVLLIRHASHDRLGRILCGRTPGIMLSDRGRSEAKSLADAVRRQGGLDALYSSPLERARETAEPIAKALGTPVEIDDDLDEFDFGAWSGLSFDALGEDPDWDHWNRERDHARPPEGETMMEGQMRIARCLERLRRRHPEQTVAAVSHGDIIKAALAWGLGLPLAFYARFEISPASVSRMCIGDRSVKVWSMNQKYDA